MTTNNIIVANTTEFKIDLDRVKTWALAHLHKEKLDLGGVEINFIDTKKIHQLNLKYRGEDKPTDILTFTIPGPVVNIGAIFISPHYAEISSQEKESDLNREIWYLIGHGVKHLAGKHHK